jgi:mitochondrial fission protein ELM1
VDGHQLTKPRDETAADVTRASRGGTWIITDGLAGNESQGLAVAEAVGLPFSVKRVRVTGAMRLVPASFQIYVPPARLLRAVNANEPLAPPWPRLVVSVGRHAAPIALAVKRAAGAFALHVQNPKLPPEGFDLIAAPMHDGLTGPNIIVTSGSLHRVTSERLAEAAKHFASRIDALPSPRIAMLLGGTSRAYNFSAEDAAAFGDKLAALARESGGTLLVTASRRTAPQSLAAFSAAIKDVPHWLWDGTGDNPYFGFLALADAIVVTGDSVNMVSEAAATGKPVYVQMLKGHSTRLSRFHRLMQELGATRPFDGKLEVWHSTPIDDTPKVAAAVRRALGLAG